MIGCSLCGNSSQLMRQSVTEDWGKWQGQEQGQGKGQRQEQGIKKRQPVIAGLTSGDSIVQRKDNPSLLPLLLPLPLFLTVDAA